ncbi:helix-turn-helix domain-containing protein [Streptomyces sp. NPDC059835]|uniref:helix-turn-helix domain-containing protein n=1 Tax=Streptomyces sp. NPDC059835 TaxID=3346967 RepID=UPI0036559746
MSYAEDPSALPPFEPARARATRDLLGMTVGQAAHAITAYQGRTFPPARLEAWEAGTAVPADSEVRALAAALWCSPVDLVGEPATLAQCRTVVGLSISRTASALGMTRVRWEDAERRNRWRGTAAQTDALLRVLNPPPACFVAACGTSRQLRTLLTEAVNGWWPNHVTAIAGILPVEAVVVREALERLHLTYHRLEADVGASPRTAAAAEAQAADFLAHIDLHLWRQLRTVGEPLDSGPDFHSGRRSGGSSRSAHSSPDPAEGY